MRYSSLDPVKEKCLHIGPLNKGTDLNTSPVYLDNAALSDCQNMLYYGGALKTRPGITASESDKIESEHTADSFYATYTVTDNIFYIDGSPKKIITEKLEFDLSEYYLNVFFIDNNREKSFGGSLRFTRTSDSIFFIPDNTVFFQAKPHTASGIYAFITLVNTEDYTSKLFEIYELDYNSCEWIKAENYYIPTVYINGRGNMYETAGQAGSITSENPKLLETPNMLSGKFNAYYSSDGYSSSFVLPYCELTDDEITCRIHYSLTDYTDWTAGMGESSVTNEFMGAEVTMNVDRSKGIVYFTVGTDDYSVPYMSKYKLNNIRITATMQNGESFSDIVSCTCSTVTDSRLLLSGGNQHNRIYYAALENPLYFPKSGLIEIGDNRTPVTSFCKAKDKIIAFKPNGIYLLSVKHGGLLNTSTLLMDNSSDFYETDSFSVKRISAHNGCNNTRAVTNFSDKTVFFGTDGKLYGITDTFSIKSLSCKVNGCFKDTPDYIRNDSVLLNDSEYCYLFLYNRALVFKPDSGFNEDKTIWYTWLFPENISIADGIDCDCSPILLCKHSLKCYTAVLEGSTDTLINSDITSEKIISRFTTAHFALKGLNSEARLNRICLNTEVSGNTEIFINGRAVDFDSNTASQLNRITVFPEEYAVTTVFVTMQSDGALSFREGDIYYE